MARGRVVIAALALLAALAPTRAAGAQDAPAEIVPRDWLVLSAVDARGRRPFRPDAVFAAHLLAPDAPAPAEGGTVRGETGEAAWERREADERGGVGGGIAWAHTLVPSATERVMLAELTSAATLFVNGEPAAGDLYGLGLGAVPVLLRAGDNDLDVTGVRGGFRLVLRAPPHALLLGAADVTRPDLVLEDGGLSPRAFEIGVRLVNATDAPIPELRLATGGRGAFARVVTPSPPGGLVARGALKLPLRVELLPDAAAPAVPGTLELDVHVGGAPGGPERTETILLDVRGPGEAWRVTRRSPIDDSVQEMSVRRPSAPRAADAPAPGLVLTLHGAGVDARNQAASYAPKPDLWIVAPTNRRPFGFDWQDWGRRDAYEALEAGLAMSGADPARVHLTGHSMGGHGTWHLVVNDPDRFAAFAPSAGWASFDSYGGRPEGALADLWHAADAASDTLALLPNVVDLPAYVVHGTADDNVPASEAHRLIEALLALGGAPRSHFQEGAGHWWDGDASAGADCVDWPPVFEMFAASRRDAHPAGRTFLSVDPGVDARDRELSVWQPLAYGRPLRVQAARDDEGRVTLATENVRLLGLHPGEGGASPACVLDGAAFDAAEGGVVFERGGEGWTRVEGATPAAVEAAGGRLDPSQKGPGRTGPFKRAFDRGFVLVHGTAGDAEEDAALLARARHDAELWWYRGNGRATLVSDAAFLAPQGAAVFAGRNVILYGNRDTNAAWDAVLPEACPVQAVRGALRLGEQAWEGDALGAVFVQPRRGDPDALVGVLADTGVRGARLGATLSLFTSGVGYPDYALFGAEVLTAGDGGVLAAGWFDRSWRLP